MEFQSPSSEAARPLDSSGPRPRRRALSRHPGAGSPALRHFAFASMLIAFIGPLSGGSTSRPAVVASTSTPALLNGHPVSLDNKGVLTTWLSPTGWFDQVITRAWAFLATVPQAVQAAPFNSTILITGGDGRPHPAFYFYSFFIVNSAPLQPAAYKHNPAGLYSMIIDSALAYYSYSGDAEAIRVATRVLDYDLAYGLTNAVGAWPQVPYASAEPGAPVYQGVAEGLLNGSGDGTGYIEPDKVGEWGYSVLRLYEQTGNTRYLTAARHAAVALAGNIRRGDASHSPWPFRVNARNNITLTPKYSAPATADDYCANVIGPIRLFDELIRLDIGNTTLLQKARRTAWEWLMEYPMRNGQWANYFEDIPIYPLPDGTQYRAGASNTNVNQYVPMETARYLLQHPEFDPNWMADAQYLLQWVERWFAHNQYGANAIGEQSAYNYPMGSHTARYASVSAMFGEKATIGKSTGDAFQNAQNAFAWASYMLNADGSVTTGPDPRLSFQSWFSDGYGDYVRHFLAGLGAYPPWAMGTGNHLLRSTSVVQEISYAADQITYRTYDRRAQEVLILDFAPSSVVSVSGEALPNRSDPAEPGWELENNGAGSYTVKVTHHDSNSITISR
jgi:hypothetical protein